MSGSILDTCFLRCCLQSRPAELKAAKRILIDGAENVKSDSHLQSL